MCPPCSHIFIFVIPRSSGDPTMGGAKKDDFFRRCVEEYSGGCGESGPDISTPPGLAAPSTTAEATSTLLVLLPAATLLERDESNPTSLTEGEPNSEKAPLTAARCCGVIPPSAAAAASVSMCVRLDRFCF